MLVPFVNFGQQYRDHKEEYDEAIFKCLNEGKLILQDDVEKFEQELAQFLGMKHVIGVANGTDALIIGLLANKEVIGSRAVISTTDYTFKATHEAIHHIGCSPQRHDIDKHSRMPIEHVELPVHIEGMVHRSDNAIIEDGCQALGAKGVGYSGTVAYSFYPAKILGGFGDGGAIATNSDEVARRARLYRHHWQTDEDEEYAYNSRLDNVQAAFLSVKLKYLPEILKRREEIAEKYKVLKGYVDLPYYQEGRVWQDYVIRTKEPEKMRDFLKANDIQVLGVGMTPPHQAMDSFHDLPNSIKLYREMLRLPCNETISDEQVDYVIEKVKEYVSTM